MPTPTKAFGVVYETGDEGARTLDLRIANATLSQLSYVPGIPDKHIINIPWVKRVSVLTERRRRGHCPVTVKPPSEKEVERELRAMLASRFPGMTIGVGTHPRWNRPAATFTWAGFTGLLPEERFHRLMTVIPDEFRASKMAGFIWLELTPKETIDDLLKMPRSEDVEGRKAQLTQALTGADFSNKLASQMGMSAQQTCTGDFQKTCALLSGLKFSAAAIQDTKLLFIRQGAYCDCQVLECMRKGGSTSPTSPKRTPS